MASSYTGLGTELMTTGENAGTWGTTTNTNLQILEQIAGGYVEQSVTSTPTTLSVSDGSAGATLAHRIIKFTGTISANTTVTVPLDVQQMYVLVNGTAGAYTLTFKYVSGSGDTVTWAATDKGTKLVYAAADHATNPNMVDSGIGSTAGHDLDGNELILDADADTSITADTDDQIDIRIAGADDFQFTANTFTAQAGSTIAAQALTATTVTASGIVKTDDTTEATSTTDGSLQTDGGLSVAKDAVIGDDVKLLSDSAVLSFGADSDTTLTHTDGTGLTLNSTNKLCLRDSALSISSSTDGQLDIDADTEVEIATTTLDLNGALDVSGASQFSSTITVGVNDTGYDVKFFGATSGAYMLWDESADDLVLAGAAGIDLAGDIDVDGTANLDAVDIDGAVQIDNTVTVGVDDTGYDVKFFGDTASAYMLWDTSADDLILGGAAGLIVPDGQFTLGSTAVSATAAEINLIDGGTARGTTAVADGDGLLVNDGGTMRMTNVTTLKTYFQSGAGVAADDISTGDGAVTLATSSGNITIDATANDTDIIFKGTDDSSDITMLTLDGSDAGSATFNHDIILGNDSFVRFGDAGEKITGDGTDLTIDSSNDLHLTATTDINVPQNVGMTFGDDGEKIEGDGTDLTIASSAKLNLTATSDVHIPNNVGIVFGGDSEKIEGDGTDLTISANNLTIDCAADLILDAGGDDFNFKAGGTEVLRITNSSNDVIIKPIVDAKDIIFQQRDGTEVARIEDNATFNVVTDKLAINGTAITSTAAEINKLDGVGTLKEAGKETIWVPAVAMYPNSTNGCADLAQTELSNGPEIKTLDFDKDSDEFAQFAIAFPKSWNEGTVTFQAFFTANTTNTGTTAWGLAGVALADDGALNTAFGTTVVATAKAMSGTANDLAVTAESGAVTIAGSPSTDEYVFFQIQRDVSADDLTADSKLLGIKLFFTTDAKNDA